MALEAIESLHPGVTAQEVQEWATVTTDQLAIRGSREIVAASENAHMAVTYLGIKALNGRLTNTLAQGDTAMTATLTEARDALQARFYASFAQSSDETAQRSY